MILLPADERGISRKVGNRKHLICTTNNRMLSQLIVSRIRKKFNFEAKPIHREDLMRIESSLETLNVILKKFS